MPHLFWPAYYITIALETLHVYWLAHPWRYVAVDSLALPAVSEQLCLVPRVQTFLRHVLLHHLHVLVCGGSGTGSRTVP